MTDKEATRAPAELKKTLNLPKTDFPMKANLPTNEPKLLERWKEMNIYGKIRKARGEVRPTCCMTGRHTLTVPFIRSRP